MLPVTEDCAAKGIKRLVMISVGFKEAGEQSTRLEKDLLKIVKNHGMRLLGPEARHDQIAMRSFMTFSLTYDHGMF